MDAMEKRRRAIVELVNDKGTISFAQLKDAFPNVSEMTLRTDLKFLDEENRILIVLSDGRPNDVIVNRPGSRNPKPYCGEYGVQDTAWEVRSLRGNGIFVLGVFTGDEKDLAAEKIIFGKDFAYIRDIRNFSRVVSGYLQRLLEQDLEE